MTQLPWAEVPDGLHLEGSPSAGIAFPSTSGLERSQEGGGEYHRDIIRRTVNRTRRSRIARISKVGNG